MNINNLTDEELRIIDPAAWSKKHKDDHKVLPVRISLGSLDQEKYKCKFPVGCYVDILPLAAKKWSYEDFGMYLKAKPADVCSLKNIYAQSIGEQHWDGTPLYRVWMCVDADRFPEFVHYSKCARGGYSRMAGQFIGARNGGKIGIDTITDANGLVQLVEFLTVNGCYARHFASFCTARRYVDAQ